MRCDVIIPIYNAIDCVKECVNRKKNWITAINGTIIICQEIPIPLNKQNNKIIKHEIKKLTNPLKTTDIGNRIYMKLIHDLYNYRELLKSNVKKEIRGKYKGSFLGILWSFINPLLQTIVYTIVFSIMFSWTNIINIYKPSYIICN